MPLAIELAAGRLSTFSLTDLRDRLDRSLDLLGGAGPAATPGIEPCGRPSSGPTSCSPTTSSGCSGTSPSSSTGSTSTPPSIVAADLGLADDAGSCWPGSSTPP